MNNAFIFVAAFSAALAAATAGLARPAQAPGQKPQAGQSTRPEKSVNFTRDLAPIIFSNCAVCHHANGAAPFPLLSYQDVRKHGRQIAEVTASRYMPPWLPDADSETFVDQRRLTKQQIETFQQWVEAGMPEGNPSDLPPAPQFGGGWELGKPDLVLTAAKAWTLPAGGGDTYRNFIFQVPISATRYVKAVEIRPGNKKVVHHANLLIDRKHSSRRLEGEDGQPGFPGMDVALESDAFEPDSHFIFWKPGTVPGFEPEGMSWRLDPDTDLVLNVHLQPSGIPEAIQPSIGLYFTDQPPAIHPMLVQLERDDRLDIPAGEKNFAVSEDFALPVDADVLAVYPHAHYLGKELQSYATLPDGTRRSLIRIAQWDPNWQGIYRFAKPIHLPKGSVISMRYSYDNSAGNIRNPNHPPRRVTAGNSSKDEMAHLWLQVLPRPAEVNGEDARIVLQEALTRHKLVKDPNDYVAHFNLGAVLFARHQVDAAVEQFEQARRIRPDSSTVFNSLGPALLAQGKTDAAVAAFREAVRLSPDNADAYYNLAIVLAGHGQIEECLQMFQKVLQLNPHDADAEANLGTAYAQLGNVEEAEQHYRRALEMNPENALALENLAMLKEQRKAAHGPNQR